MCAASKGQSGAELRRAADAGRDQSYFLFATTPEQLAFLRFPLGGLPKSQVPPEAAARLGLSVADKPDSQDICFVPEGKYTTVIDRLRPDELKPGDVVHMDGRVLGRHEGVTRYTVGQRRGLERGGGRSAVRGEESTPMRSQVIVGPREALLTASLFAERNELAGRKGDDGRSGRGE